LSDIGDRFSNFALRSTAGHPEDMQVLYGVGGERRVDAQEIPLAGWNGAQPVRIGNGAVGQVQRDEPSEILQQCVDRHRRGYEFDADEWRFLARLADHVVHTWRDPGHGFWEMPGPPRRFVYSEAAAHSALDSVLEIAAGRDDADGQKRWRGVRRDIVRTVLEEGFDACTGCFIQSPGSSAVDCTALLLPYTGVVGWRDPRMLSTVDVLIDRLGEGGLMRRYDSPDGLDGREGTFLACAFWLVECLARQGRVAEASERYERALETASPLGLYSEEYDARTQEPLGNYPQALTHLSQIGAALALRDAAHQ
jgi:GH15 family glucan-1,4-alpha-glucosidase